MQHRSSLGFLIVIAALVVAVSVGVTSQWLRASALRGERDLLRVEAEELGRLQRENERLRAKQIPAAELEALRADHAALPRLRVELEALKKSGVGEK
jgi:hypothetical protein